MGDNETREADSILHDRITKLQNETKREIKRLTAEIKNLWEENKRLKFNDEHW